MFQETIIRVDMLTVV